MASLSPSPDKILSHQMASLSPSPNGIFKPIPSIATSPSANFLGTLVSNLLLPSSRERQTCQSNSSGSRRLNRGNCCTPKFALLFYHKKSQLRDFPDFSDRLKNRSNRLFLSIRQNLGLSLIFKTVQADCLGFVWIGSGLDQADASLTLSQN